MRNIKHNLTNGVFIAVFLTFLAAPVLAQKQAPASSEKLPQTVEAEAEGDALKGAPIAAPVAPVTEEALPADALVLSQGPVVIELFSSQACVFCPRADRLLLDMARQEQVIALACHVDYFDVRTGSLAQPFCSVRQDWYMRTLHAGPNYTPQMVVQGVHDVVGYDIPDLTDALRLAAGNVPPAISISYDAAAKRYNIALPARGEDRNYRLTLFVYDKDRDVIVSEGRNKGQKMKYVGIVSALEDLGTWNAKDADEMQITVERKDGQQGFVVLAQDEKTGEIGAAGKYVFGAQKAALAVND